MSYNAKKSLSYEMEEPVFLRRLRQGQSGGEQQQRYIALRNKKRPIDDDDEDAPTYVLEGGNDTITGEEFKALNGGKFGDDREDAEKDNTPAAEEEAAAEEGTVISLEKPLDTKEKILEAGRKINKRKAVKLIGAEEGDDTIGQADENLGRKKRAGGKAKGKGKVKLSFGEDE
ncbi:hypothetical protein BGX38DRAFT_1172837 [Terfezia claveryi]|nr:hypothetical protein BGX38DRAFT_1172837 [Terfezia claveryi]